MKYLSGILKIPWMKKKMLVFDEKYQEGQKSETNLWKKWFFLKFEKKNDAVFSFGALWAYTENFIKIFDKKSYPVNLG